MGIQGLLASGIDLVTVFDAILTSRQTCEKLQCLNENLMSNNFRKTAVLKKKNGGAKVQVTGHRSGNRPGYRSQATGQVTGHRPQARSQVRPQATGQVTGQITGHTQKQ